MGASMALAGMAGCGRTPEQHIVPYVKQPDGLILGKPQQYATVMPFGADAVGILVESHEGRPTKIEGKSGSPIESWRVGCLCAGFDSRFVRSRPRENADVRGRHSYLGDVSRRSAGPGDVAKKP